MPATNYLIARRAELVEHRADLADRIHGPTAYEALAKLVTVHHAIAALDAVIAEDRPARSPWDDEAFSLTVI